MKKLAIATCLGLMLPAMVQSRAVSAGEEPQVLTVSLVQEVGFVLNPAIGGSNFNLRFLNNIYLGLIDPTDKQTAFRPALADHWEVNQGGTVYRFRLRDDAYWSDGEPITPEMVLESFQYLATLDAGFALYDFAEADIQLIEQDGRDWIEFDIHSPNPAFMAAVAVETASVLPLHLQDTLDFSADWGDMDPAELVYSGPYILTDNAAEQITLQQNPMFFDRDMVEHDEVVIIKPHDSGGEVVQAFHDKAVDFAFVSDAGNTATVSRILPESLVIDDVNIVDFLMFNSRTEVLQDPEIRFALRLVAADAYPDQFFEQNWLNRIDSLFSPGIENSYDIKFASGVVTVSPEERLPLALSIMEAKGYTAENPLQLTMIVGESELNARVAAFQRSQWGQIHVDLQLEILPFSEFQHRMMRADFEIARTGWQYDYDHPLAILDLYRSDSTFNFAGYSAPEFDQALSGLALQSDPEKIALFSTKAMRILDESNMVVPLFSRSDVYLRQADISLDQAGIGEAVRHLHMISRRPAREMVHN